MTCKHEFRLLKNIVGHDDQADVDWDYSIFYCIKCLELRQKDHTNEVIKEI